MFLEYGSQSQPLTTYHAYVLTLHALHEVCLGAIDWHCMHLAQAESAYIIANHNDFAC